MADTLADLHRSLEHAGWRFGSKPYNAMDRCSWYAWLPQRPKDWPDCECNDKPPSFTLTPYLFETKGNVHASAEFRLCGEMGGKWFDLKLYSVRLQDALGEIPKAIEALGAAWKAIAALENKEQT